MRYTNPLIVGVTGGMGSGQSTVCGFFEKWGCKIINADQKAKDVIAANRPLQNDLKKVFGNDIFTKNGKLDRKRMAELAFRDELNTQKLNQLVHPRMVESLIDEMEKARFSGKYPVVVIDAALVYEISMEHNFDYVIVVYCNVRQRQQRVFQRDGMSRREFNERVGKQLPLEEKVKWADFVIQNKAGLQELEAESRKVFDKLMQLQRKIEKRESSSQKVGKE